MRYAMAHGEVIGEGEHWRVLYHEERQQRATFWVQENGAWYVERFYEGWDDALAHAVRWGGNG